MTTRDLVTVKVVMSPLNVLAAVEAGTTLITRRKFYVSQHHNPLYHVTYCLQR